jgi:hypothetical protein
MASVREANATEEKHRTEVTEGDGGPAYVGGKTFATTGDQGKEMAKVAEHKDLGSSSFRNKKRTMIEIVLMGAGRMARVHASAIGAAGGKLVIVYDVVESAANSLAAEFGTSVARSAQEVFDRSDVAASW